MEAKPWELLDSAEVPDSGGTMRLMRQGPVLMIHVDDRELMRSTVHGSEDALAELSCDRLGQRQGARVLIGGLGMGFTLAAALRSLGARGAGGGGRARARRGPLEPGAAG